MNVQIVFGDLLDQDVDVIVNAWNRNFIPWWLLLPQGISKAIKRHGGIGPFKELRRYGAIPLGGAVLTSAGKLPSNPLFTLPGSTISGGQRTGQFVSQCEAPWRLPTKMDSARLLFR